MQNFVRSFVREKDGTWVCVEAATLDLPTGRIQVAAGARFAPGSRFMGVDLVRLLEEKRLPGETPPTIPASNEDEDRHR